MEDTLFESTGAEEQKEKRKKKHTEPKELTGCLNVCMDQYTYIEVSKGKETEAKRVFDEIMTKNFPNVRK